MTWETRPSGNAFVVGKVDEEGQLVRLHPIPFDSEFEAGRGAARLNARDAGIAGVPVPTLPEDEARAARLARIAELRSRNGWDK